MPNTPTSERAPLPGFRPQPTPPMEDPPGPTVTSSSTADQLLEDQPSRPGPSRPADGDAVADLGGVSRPIPSPASSEAFEVGIGMALRTGALVANARLAPGSERWIPNQDEVDAIAGPLGRIAARHAPITGGQSNDVMDAIEASVAAGGFVMRNIVEARLEAAQDAEVPTYTEP